MLINQQQYLRNQRALDAQPKMFDQAFIMRVHQTARAQQRNNNMHQSPHKAEMPANNFFPAV